MPETMDHPPYIYRSVGAPWGRDIHVRRGLFSRSDSPPVGESFYLPRSFSVGLMASKAPRGLSLILGHIDIRWTMPHGRLLGSVLPQERHSLSFLVHFLFSHKNSIRQHGSGTVGLVLGRELRAERFYQGKEAQ